jgi:hypothetical protein
VTRRAEEKRVEELKIIFESIEVAVTNGIGRAFK